VSVDDRLAEHGTGLVAEGAGEETTVEVDGRELPARRWPLPEGWVLQVEEPEVVHTVTVTGDPGRRELGLITLDDVPPLLDEYVRLLGWSRS
jgi:hypothetical protein